MYFFYEDGSRLQASLVMSNSIMPDGYNAYVFIGNELKSARFKDTIHQVYMFHANNKFVKADNQGGEPVAGRFLTLLKRFF